MPSTRTKIGSLNLKNPVIAAPGEHMITESGIRAAILSGAGAVVGKSTNESDAAKDQLTRAEYVGLDSRWRPVRWGADAPTGTMLLSRSGLTPQPFDEWLAMSLRLRDLAREHDCLYVPSLILAEESPALDMARTIAAAGFDVLEFNIGTPYASQAAKGAVSTVLDPARIGRLTRMMTEAIDIPLWIKITGQSERVPDLAKAAFDNGAQSVVMAGRALGMLPDLETQAPVLSTSCGFGGFWNLPLTCHWLANTRALVGPDHALTGINGATDGDDVLRMVLAGASAVGLSSEVMMRGFDVLKDAVRTIENYCTARDTDLSDLVGRAAGRRAKFADMPQLVDNWRRYVPGAAQNH